MSLLKTPRDAAGYCSRKNWSNRLSGSDFSTTNFSANASVMKFDILFYPYRDLKTDGDKNGQRAADIRSVVHVAGAQKSTQINDIVWDEPVLIIRKIDCAGSQPTVK